MRVGVHLPRLLDILDIPLGATGPDFGFESENRTILPGQWYLRGQADAKDLTRYSRRPYYVLHNRRKYVTLDEMKLKPLKKRTTLELIHVDGFDVRDKRERPSEKHQWQGTVFSGGRELELPITDPFFVERLSKGHAPSKSCLLTMSLGMPYKPPDWPPNEPPACWKLIAGVVEL